MKYFKIVLLTTILFFTGCSSISVKDEFNKNNMVEMKIKQYYDTWEVDYALKTLDSSELQKTDNNKYEKIFKKILKRKEEKLDLHRITKEILEELKKNNFEEIKKYIDKSIYNILKLNELSKNDLSQAEIYFGEGNYLNNIASFTVAVTFNEETIYVIVTFELVDGKWRIIDLAEKG